MYTGKNMGCLAQQSQHQALFINILSTLKTLEDSEVYWATNTKKLEINSHLYQKVNKYASPS